MDTETRIQRWLGIAANLAILAGLIFVLAGLRQNTEQLRVQLRDQINSRLYDNNRVLMGENPISAIEKSVLDPESMTYADFRIVDAYLINAVHEWEDRYSMHRAGLAPAEEWTDRVDEDVAWFFGNQFAKSWWAETGALVLPPELAEYVSAAIEAVPDGATYEFFEAVRIRAPG